MGGVLDGQQVQPMAQALGPAALHRLPSREHKWDWFPAGRVERGQQCTHAGWVVVATAGTKVYSKSPVAVLYLADEWQF